PPSPRRSALFPYTTLFRSTLGDDRRPITRTIEQPRQRRIVRRQPQHRRTPALRHRPASADRGIDEVADRPAVLGPGEAVRAEPLDRKSTRLNSSHVKNSYA